MPVLRHTVKERGGLRASPVRMCAAAVAAAAVVVVVLATSVVAAATYGGTAAQERHTLKFLEEFPDEIDELQDTWRGSDFCQWPGVVCYGNGTVDVELANQGLHGEMPGVDSDIDGSLVTVRSVNLSGNPGIGKDFEEDWKSLTVLERLDLSGTSLKDSLPDEWERMSSLTYLNISGTSACKSLPRWHSSSMRKLSVIDFSNCSFRGTVTSSFGSLSSTITEAHFEGNNLCGCLPSTFPSDNALTKAIEAANPEIGAANCAIVNQCASDADSCSAVVTPEENTLEFLREIADEFDDQLEYMWVGSDYCNNWPGVTCNTDGTVEVNLSGLDLSGDMPEIDDDIDASKVLVTSVDLSNNPRLEDDFEDDWGRLKKLRFLNLSNTALEGSLPYKWNGMTSLETLDVHNTIACKSLPNWQLPNLRYVDLSSSSFYGTLRDTWAQMTTLETVKLEGNNFCGCVPSTWTSNAALERAVNALGSAGVTADDCANVNSCSYLSSRCTNPNAGSGGTASGDPTYLFLQQLALALSPLHNTWTGTDYCSWSGVACSNNGTVTVDLKNRGLTGYLPEISRGLNGANVNIVSMDLSNNPQIRGNFRSDWAALKQLEFLDLSFTGLYGNIPDAWNGLTALREVHIHNTAACRNLPNWNVWSMPNLRTVDFSYNNMGGALAYSWSTFTQLQSVNLAGNSFCGCVPSTWPTILQNALGADALALSSTCSWLNVCSSVSYRCSAVPNSNTGGGAGGGGSSSAATPAPSSTLQFLQSLNSALNVGWSGTDYCTFSGVTCSTVDGVSMASVSLSGRGLQSTSLPALGDTVNGARVFITRIDLSNNPNIAGSFPDSWSALKQLEFLDLSSTSLRGNIPDAWDGMYSLEEIHVNNTLACRSLPNWRGSSLSRLRVVDFGSNPNMRGVLTSSWSELPALTSLNIQGTNFCGCMPMTWSRKSVLSSAATAAGVPAAGCLTNGCTGVSFMCPSAVMQEQPTPTEDPTLQLLRRIASALARVAFGAGRAERAQSISPRASGQTLEQNWTGDDYCNYWMGVTCNLTTGEVTLNLSDTGLQGELPALDNIEGAAVSFVSIDFSGNPDITGTFPASWGNLKGLRELRLSTLGIASSLPKEWEGMESLESLTVSNTRACGSLPSWSASSLANLRALDLSNNSLSGTLPASLGDFTQQDLENFTLAGNTGICGCAPTSWASAALLSGAQSANNELISADCTSSSVPCESQSACRAAGAGGDGALGGASSMVAAWVVAAFLAFTVL